MPEKKATVIVATKDSAKSEILESNRSFFKKPKQNSGTLKNSGLTYLLTYYHCCILLSYLMCASHPSILFSFVLPLLLLLHLQFLIQAHFYDISAITMSND